MAINRGNILGQVFNLPPPTETQFGDGQAPSSRGAAAPTMNDQYFGIPDTPKGLQYTDQVDKQSQQVFKRWSDLRNFAQSLWSLYNIDVTKPDPSRPESIAANQAFHQERANIQYEIDKLQESGKQAYQLNPMFASGAITPTAQYGQEALATQLPQEAYQTTGLSEPSKAVIGTLSKSFERPEDYKRALAQGQQYVQSLRARGLVREADDVAKAILPSRNIPQPSSGGNQQEASAFEFLKRASAIHTGASNYKASKTYVDPGSRQPLLETTDGADAFEGFDPKSGRELKGIIKANLLNPQTGQRYLKLSTSDELIPVSLTEYVYGVSKANPKYPTVDKIQSYLSKYGGSDNVGEIIPGQFLDRSALDKATNTITGSQPELDQILKSDQELQGLINTAYQGNQFMRWIKDNSTTPPLPSLGDLVIEFQRNKEGDVVIQNEADLRTRLKSLGYTSEQIAKYKNQIKNPKGFFDFLKEFEASVTPEAIKAEELIKKYGSQ